MRFETLGRRIAAAPRAIVLGLVALTVALTPGAVRVRVAAASPDAPELASFALTCESGVWSLECLASVDELTRALANAPALVARVDSLATRQQFVLEGGALRLRPLIAELPADRDALRRLRARAAADPAATRGLVAPGEVTTLVRAELRDAASPDDVHALVETLRSRFARSPGPSVAVVARAWSERELAQTARRDLARLLPATLAALALLAGLALASARAGALVAALAGVAAFWCAGLSGLAGLDLGVGAAALSSAVAATAAAGALALAHRLRSERRAARGDVEAVGRALASLGVPLGAAALAGAAAFLALALAADGTARALALGASCGVAGAAVLVLVGLPAGWLAVGAGTERPGARTFETRVEAALARLDAGLRTRGSWRRSVALLAFFGAAAFGALRLESDPAPGRFLAEGSAVRDGVEQLARGFGGSERVRVELDSGSDGGALEPRFLEGALALEQALASIPSVGSTGSLLDGVLLPAMRALHDGDPGFAVVPPTRAQVEEVLALLAREAPARLTDGLDPARRRFALELWIDARDPRALERLEPALAALSLEHLGRRDAASLHGRALRAVAAGVRLRRGALFGAFAALAVLGALAGAALGSARAGLLAGAPSALAALVAFGALGQLGLPLDSLSASLGALAALAGAAPALLYLTRVRELRAAGAERGVAVSVALRDAGRPIAVGALAGLTFLGLLASAFPPVRWFGALAAFEVLVATGLCLVVLPALVRRFPV